MKSSVRVRFAPSPTGPLHMGGVRTALYNYLFAKKNGGTFLLRIEDTDQARYVPQAEEYIINSLKWCGIVPEEGIGFNDGEFKPYRQSERTELYREYAKKLVETGHAYYAFDTTHELENMRIMAEKRGMKFKYDANSRMKMRNSLSLDKNKTDELIENEEYVIRFKIPENEDIIFQDVIRDTVTYNSKDLDDKILLKADGYPTYHLANIVDDQSMKISHVIRGEEWLPSTPLHVLLYKAFGWESTMPQFAHLPLILKPEGQGKLSKRDGYRHGFPVFPMNWIDPETNELLPGYKETGFLPSAFLNMLALLGWHTSEDKEIFTLEELIQEFSLERVVKAGARFDYNKAKWINQQHLIASDDAVLGKELKTLAAEKGFLISEDFSRQVCKLMKERVYFLLDIFAEAPYFFKEVESYDEKMVKKKFDPEKDQLYISLVRIFEKCESFGADKLELIVKEFAENNKLGLGAILPVIR